MKLKIIKSVNKIVPLEHNKRNISYFHWNVSLRRKKGYNEPSYDSSKLLPVTNQNYKILKYAYSRRWTSTKHNTSKQCHAKLHFLLHCWMLKARINCLCVLWQKTTRNILTLFTITPKFKFLVVKLTGYGQVKLWSKLKERNMSCLWARRLTVVKTSFFSKMDLCN